MVIITIIIIAVMVVVVILVIVICLSYTKCGMLTYGLYVTCMHVHTHVHALQGAARCCAALRGAARVARGREGARVDGRARGAPLALRPPSF